MATHREELSREAHPNGGSLAAFLAAGIGSFAMGGFVLLNAAGVFAAPSFYGPAGGLSGRSTLAVVVWVAAWVWLHRRWRGRELEARTVYLATFALTALGVLATFPPLWGLF